MYLLQKRFPKLNVSKNRKEFIRNLPNSFTSFSNKARQIRHRYRYMYKFRQGQEQRRLRQAQPHPQGEKSSSGFRNSSDLFQMQY
jgi:hypothetical protein